MRKISALILVFLTLMSSVGFSIDTFQTFTAANPTTSRRGQWIQLMARGTGTNDMYVMEVDPVTGALPISGSISATNPSVSTTGDPVPLSATLVGGEDPGGDLIAISLAADGSVNVVFGGPKNYGTPDADTPRMAAMLGVGSTAVSNANPVPISDAGGTITVDGTVAATQSGTWNITDISGTVSLPTGASTSALQTTGNTSLSSIDGKMVTEALNFGSAATGLRTSSSIGNATGIADFGSGASSAQTLRTILATDQTAIEVTATNLDIRDLTSVSDSVSAVQSGTWNVNNVSGTISLPTGAATSANQATEIASLASIDGKLVSQSKSISLKYRNDYSSVNVTTGAYVQVVASTSAVINKVWVFDSSGSAIILATGAAAAEVDLLYIPPGGFDTPIEVNIPASTRLSIKALDTDATSGQIIINAVN